MARRMAAWRPLLWLLCALAACSIARAQPPGERPRLRNASLSIALKPGAWSDAHSTDIEAALLDVAGQLLGPTPLPQEARVIVGYDARHPVVLYQRGPAGQHQVFLHARAGQWGLFVYEFAHELCHIVSNYGAVEPPLTGGHKANQWFEESLCEAASLFALDAVARQWEASPPDSQWQARAAALRRFATQLQQENHRALPPGQDTAQWLTAHLADLRQSPYHRALNDVVATALLPHFQREPGGWRALGYLNLDPADGSNAFREYLDNWLRHTPPAQQAFVAEVARLLGQHTPAPRVAYSPSAGAR